MPAPCGGRNGWCLSDLARWLGGHYAIAGREDAEEDESAAPDTLQKRLMDDADDDE